MSREEVHYPSESCQSFPIYRDRSEDCVGMGAGGVG